MTPRFHVAIPLITGLPLTLPPAASRHVQVLRLQPGSALVLFDGSGSEWRARVDEIGRRDVSVTLLEEMQVERELPFAVELALGMPANDRMDGLVEKATELGAIAIQPLMCERSVLRLVGERAAKKVAHWQAVAIAASEQSGRGRVPQVRPVRSLADWLPEASARADIERVVLSLRDDALAAASRHPGRGLIVLSGPEGGLSEAEENAARAAGFQPMSLGPRVLRADTAPLAALAALGALGHTR
jgi:16S rRNA (uracil1498-N3)-methyltransferase